MNENWDIIVEPLPHSEPPSFFQGRTLSLGYSLCLQGCELLQERGHVLWTSVSSEPVTRPPPRAPNPSLAHFFW